MSPHPVAPVSFPALGAPAFGKLNLETLVFEPVIPQGHPALAELLSRHPMAIVNNGQCAAELGGEKQIDFARACIPAFATSSVRATWGTCATGPSSGRR